jgi:phenylpyruvate tautomerase
MNEISSIFMNIQMYVLTIPFPAISVTDNASMIFAGSEAPMALGCVYSIASIEKESNGAITSSVTDALESYGVAADRIYINFFDMPRANLGWNRKTFAG